MYSWEIDEKIKKYNNQLPSSVYLEISNIDKNIQIVHIEYNGYSENFTMWTNDGWCWNFQVYRDKE